MRSHTSERVSNAHSRVEGTHEPAEKKRFEVAALEAWMREHVEGFAGPLTVERFKGGQSNPTFKLVAPGQCYVMRAKPGPASDLLPSAHAIEREYRVMSALAATDVPVPRVFALCEDESIIGSAFYIMEFVSGRVLWDPSLPDMTRAERSAIYDEMNRVISALHRVDYRAIGLGDYGKPGNYFSRQINRWTRQYRLSKTESIPAMDSLIGWLPENIPHEDADHTTLVHGDYRIDNLMFHPTEPRVVAVLDWELSTLGHALADFAYHCMNWHIAPGQAPGIGGMDLAALGIPDEAAYRRMYEMRSGRKTAEDWNFYLAFNMFRVACILQGIVGRVVDGTASSAQALQVGSRARLMAEMGWQYALKARQQARQHLPR